MESFFVDMEHQLIYNVIYFQNSTQGHKMDKNQRTGLSLNLLHIYGNQNMDLLLVPHPVMVCFLISQHHYNLMGEI